MKVQGFSITTPRALRGLFAMVFVAGLCAAGPAHAASLSGRVTDAATGAPFANQTVTVTAGTWPLPVTSAQTQTDALGYYSLSFDCDWYCSIRVVQDGYLDGVYNYPPAQAQVVANIALVREARVSGHVVLPAGVVDDDFRGVYVQEYDADSGEWYSWGYQTRRVGVDGFEITKLKAGTYRICYAHRELVYHCYAGHDQGSTGPVGFTPVVLAAGDTRTDVDLAPQRGTAVSGTIRNADTSPGAPSFAQAFFDVYGENGELLQDFRIVGVDAAGHYEPIPMAPGRYYVVARATGTRGRVWPSGNCDEEACDVAAHGQLFTVPASGEVTNLDFALSPYAIVRARLHDRDSGAPILGAQFGAWTYLMGPTILPPSWYDASSGEYVAYAERDNRRIGASASGYIAHFAASGDCPGGIFTCLGASSNLDLQPGETRSIDLTLQRIDPLFADGFDQGEGAAP